MIIKNWIKSLFPIYTGKNIIYKYANGINGNPDFFIDASFINGGKEIIMWLCIFNPNKIHWSKRIAKIECNGRGKQ